MPSIRQPSFASGELAPSFYGRTDLPRYATGLRTCKNFFIGKQGSAISRPGTKYLGSTSGQGARLIPFVWSTTATDQNYVVQVIPGNIYIWKNGTNHATAS